MTSGDGPDRQPVSTHPRLARLVTAGLPKMLLRASVHGAGTGGRVAAWSPAARSGRSRRGSREAAGPATPRTVPSPALLRTQLRMGAAGRVSPDVRVCRRTPRGGRGVLVHRPPPPERGTGDGRSGGPPTAIATDSRRRRRAAAPNSGAAPGARPHGSGRQVAPDRLAALVRVVAPAVRDLLDEQQ